MTAREATEALRSDRCQCGHGKAPGLALCGECWFFLADDVREALRRRAPSFREAYEAALEDLKNVVTIGTAKFRSRRRRAGGE